MHWRDNGLSAVLVMSVAVLPFVFLPTRIEGHETYRAGMLALLVACALPAFRRFSFTRQQTILLLVVGLWCAALFFSSIFSLSPSRSFAGDFFRRMGLWTQLALVMGSFIASRFQFTTIWRWFWLAGLVVAVHAIIEFFMLDAGGRPKGLLGWSTFTAGWLVLAVLWSLLGLWAERHNLTRIESAVYGFGIVMFLAAILALGARGAALGLVSGLVTAILIWIIWHGRRKWIIVLIIPALVGSAGLVMLSRLDWGGKQNPFAQLETSSFDPFRSQIWAHALAVVQQWPTLSSAYGEIDRWAFLRSLFGYGLEMYSPPSSTIDLPVTLDLGHTPVDRAHNVWFDTLISMGWFGVLAWLALWLTAGWLALSRLGFRSFYIGWLVFIGSLLGIIVTWETPYIALAGTIGGLGGFWIGLLLAGRSTLPNPFDPQAWLAIAVLTAHMVELQFGFDTVATSWPAWLALGLLLTPSSPSEVVTVKTPSWAWIAVGGAFLIRGMASYPGIWMLIPLLILGLAVAYFISPFPRFSWFWIAMGWAVGGLFAGQSSPEVLSLGSILILLVGMLLCNLKSEKLRLPLLVVRKSALWVLPVTIVLVWWWFDLTADHYFWLGNTVRRKGDIVTGVNDIQAGLQFRPWDARMALEAGRLHLEIAEHVPSVELESMGKALESLESAVRLNSFDVSYVLQLAEAYAQRALASSDDRLAYWQSADQYFAASAQLQPHSAMIWRRWARYTLIIMDDPIKAYALVSKAIEIDPNNEFTRRLMGQIESRLSQEH